MKKLNITYLGDQTFLLVQGLGNFEQGKPREFKVTPQMESVINSLGKDNQFRVERPEEKQFKSLKKSKKKKGGEK